jgi:hypothetical protein
MSKGVDPTCNLNFTDFPTLRRLKSHRPPASEDQSSKNQKASATTRQKSISLPQGTTFSVHIVRTNGKRKQVSLRKSPSKPNTFIALFEETNVDFEIDIDNKESKERHVSLDLGINGKTYGFVIPKESVAAMETVESNGRKFHFSTTESNNHRRSVLNLSDKWSTLSRISYSISQIKFRVQYSKIVPPSSFEVFVRSPRERIYSVEVFAESLTEDLFGSGTIRDIVGGNTDSCKFYFDGKQLESGLTLGEQGIEEGSIIQVTLQPQQTTSLANGGGDNEEDRITVLDSISLGIGEETKKELQAGICTGGKSEQQFFSKGFDVDESIFVEPFVIELRKEGACSLL